MSAPTPPPLETTREVRFAVVMYGGVSLAIYINGITQELFHLARATARGAKDASGENALLFGAPANESSDNPAKLSPTERVYRKLSYLLSDQNLLNDYRDSLYRSSVEDSSTAESQPENQKQRDVAQELDDMISRNQRPINTRFIIDIMSGTSAGGINSIYLAKALANDQRIDQLKSLWLNEGDIALLLNDQRSVADLQLPNQQPPQSLLNSRRMYLKLLSSFNEMESKGEDKKVQEVESPYVDELDLFITATDLEGVVVPIRLSDTVVFEKRHRHVFHFKYSPFRNDFRKYNNPFLAFAARCTSSFPFAFEPMRLCDIDDVVDIACGYRKDDEFTANRGTWNAFFREKLQSGVAKQLTFENRAFGDGGYLDNKPFSHATDTLTRRDAPVPVDRKLIYIEPSPEHPEDDAKAGKSTDAPNALQNVKKAVLDLPMYETIREDLERVIDRNRLINRVNRITAAIERDVDQIRLSRPSLKAGEWRTFDLADMVKRFGIYYLPYRRLRIASASDELAKLVAKTAGLDESSAYYLAIRILVRAWRETRYRDYRADGGVSEDEVDQLADRILQAMGPRASEPSAIEKFEQQKSAVQSELLSWLQINCPDYGQGKKAGGGDVKLPSASNEAVRANTANQFLIDYDFKYWMRRLTFVRQKLDELYRLNWAFAQKPNVTDDDLRDEQKAIVGRFRKLKDRKFDYFALTRQEKEDLKEALSFLKREITELYSKLKSEGRKIQSLSGASGETSQIAKAIKAIKIDPALLSYLLGMPEDADPSDQQFARINEDACVIRAKKLLKQSDVGEDSTADTYDSQLAESLQATNLSEQVNAAGDALKAEFQESITNDTNGTSIWFRSRALLNPRFELEKKLKSDKTDAVREYLWRYFSQFDDFDQVRFPILYGTDVGESDVIEIIRISPEDAPSLIAERSENEKRRKLAGTTLFNFGAFLDRSWRQNDIMWGRLDGAERLVTALLPDAESARGAQVDNSLVRKALIEEAHRAILTEEFPVAGRKALGEKMTDALLEAGKDNDLVAAVNKVADKLKKTSPTSRPLEDVLLQSLSEDGFLEFMRSGYQVNRKLDPEPMLRAVSRSTQVIGKIFEDIADKSGLQGRNLTWIARLGQIFWGLIEVAVPGSMLRLLFIHWLKLLYLFEVLLLIGGTVLVRPSIQQFGLVTLAMTLAADIGASLLHDAMLGRRKGFKWLKIFGYLVGILLGLLGLLTVFGVLGIEPIWYGLTKVHDWMVDPPWWGRWLPALIGLGLFAWIMRDDLRWLWRKYTRWLSDVRGEKA